MKNKSRRSFLRGAGVTLTLPLLGRATEDPIALPTRMLLISNNLGVLPQPFFPTATGYDYKLSPYLKELSAHRNRFTIFSGLSHPDVDGGHSTENCFLTSARGPTRSGFRNTISLDQLAAEHLGPVTRFPSLNLGVNIDKANRSLSWTQDGALLPAEDSPATLFKKLFTGSNAKEVQRQMRQLENQKSILDALLEDARSVADSLGTAYRQRMEQYLNSVREVEKRLQQVRRWARIARPAPGNPAPEDVPQRELFFERFETMLSVARLALESDSTRIITLMVDAFATPAFQLTDARKTTADYHNLSHHGQSEDKLRQLTDADLRQMQILNRLLNELMVATEGDVPLLDRTMVLFGSNMGNSNTHVNTNLPILLAGGGLKHGRHLAMSAENNTPLCNLFVTMLQQMGIETNRFGSSTGVMSELNS